MSVDRWIVLDSDRQARREERACLKLGTFKNVIMKTLTRRHIS